ncbi:MAG: hypothetical protein SXA11_10035 [Cyanobacteriota bacterium]|nr:hypothetical protein [Cyanobacteriota bacterium]
MSNRGSFGKFFEGCWGAIAGMTSRMICAIEETRFLKETGFLGPEFFANNRQDACSTGQDTCYGELRT